MLSKGECLEVNGLVGDFNETRKKCERKGQGSYLNRVGLSKFDAFINIMKLIDIPICGGRFTWHTNDDLSMSIIDKFVV